MAKAGDVGVRVEVSGEKEFTQSLAKIESGLKVNKSELELVSAQYAANANSIDALTAKNVAFENVISSQKDKVEALRAAYEKSGKANGENASRTMRLAAEYNKAQTELEKMNTALKANETALQNLDKVSAQNKLADSFKSMDSAIKVHESNVERVTAAYARNANSSDALKDKQTALKGLLDAQRQKAKALAAAMEELEQAGKGASEEANGLAVSLNKTETEAAQTKNALSGLKDKAKQAGDGFQEAEKKVSAFTVAAGELMAKAVQSAVSGLFKLVESTREYRIDMSKLEQNARSAGVGLDTTTAAMKQLNFITGETDSNIEAVSNLLSAGFTNNSMQQAIDALSGAVIKFPDTLKIESLADSLQETIATGQATGQFGEMLGRVGIKVENFNRGLQAASASGREQEYVLNTLARTGLAKVTHEYEKANSAQKEYADAQYEMNEALAEIAEKVEPIITQFVTNIAELLNKHSDTINNLVELIGNLAGVLLNIVDLLAQIPAPVYIFIGTIVLAITAIIKIKNAINTFTGGIGKMTESFSPAKYQLTQIIIVVTALAAALALLAYLFLVIRDGAEGAANAMNKMKDINVPDASKNLPRHANGTAYAQKGFAIVGERGPELVAMRGGERVLNAQRSRMLTKNESGQNPVTNNYYITLDASSVKDITDVVHMAERAKQERRAR